MSPVFFGFFSISYTGILNLYETRDPALIRRVSIDSIAAEWSEHHNIVNGYCHHVKSLKGASGVQITR